MGEQKVFEAAEFRRAERAVRLANMRCEVLRASLQAAEHQRIRALRELYQAQQGQEAACR